jgi:hypothetical protein
MYWRYRTMHVRLRPTMSSWRSTRSVSTVMTSSPPLMSPNSRSLSIVCTQCWPKSERNDYNGSLQLPAMPGPGAQKAIKYEYVSGRWVCESEGRGARGRGTTNGLAKTQSSWPRLSVD